MTTKITPVILAGDSGSRLWPLSRAGYPKQLLPLVGDKTLLQQTAARLTGPNFTAPVIIVGEDQRFLVQDQLKKADITPAAIITEPEGRNTAPAAAIAALVAKELNLGAQIILLPADHYIADLPGFQAVVQTASSAAGAEQLVTFGITPTHPETGYGYLERGHDLPVKGAYHLARFVEKPSLEKAVEYLASGRYSWNSGMFLCPVDALLRELQAYEPEMVQACEASLKEAVRDNGVIKLGASFSRAKNISLDYAVMERTAHAALVPASIGWSDIGAWPALLELSKKDASGNAVLGDVLLHNTRNTYVRGHNKLIAVVGMDDAIIVDSDDALLVAHVGDAQNVKVIVDALKKDNRKEAKLHRLVHRPWGYYDSVDNGPGFQVKRIMVKPGAKLSLQKHAHRAEHWTVVAGKALVTVDAEQKELGPNQSVFIPLGAVHRLENIGTEDLYLIEVQCGSYLGEDDIVRLEDIYGRS